MNKWIIEKQINGKFLIKRFGEKDRLAFMVGTFDELKELERDLAFWIEDEARRGS